MAAKPSPVIKGDFKDLKHTSTGRVEKIIDARTVLMKDGKIIRLSGIEYPVAFGQDDGQESMDAKARLAALLPEGTEVLIYQSRNTNTGRINRMGHQMAHIALKKDERWINGTIVGEGLGWAMTDKDVTELAPQLYRLEDIARTAQRGLWAKNSAYPLLTPEDAVKGSGSFRVVEGTVLKTASMKNSLYLNFGKDWHKDFTVMVTPGVRKAMARQGTDPMAFAGRKVRVRGWIRDWNGPFMELDTAARIEILLETIAAAPVDERTDSALPYVPSVTQGKKTGLPNP